MENKTQVTRNSNILVDGVKGENRCLNDFHLETKTAGPTDAWTGDGPSLFVKPQPNKATDTRIVDDI